MKHIFKSLLLIILALGSTNVFGMKSLFDDSKEQVAYTPGTQRSPSMPPASAALTPQTMMGLTLSQAAWQNRDVESHMDESKQEITIKDHSKEPRFQILYELLAFMPSEIINTILDYEVFAGRLVRTIPIDEHSFFLFDLITISPHVIGACFLRNDFSAETKTAIVDLETGEELKAMYARALPAKVSENELAFNNHAHGIDITNWQTGTTTTIRTDENFDQPSWFPSNIAKVPDGPLMIYNKDTIEFWDPNTRTKIKEIIMYPSISRAQPLSEQTIATEKYSSFTLWDIHTGSIIKRIFPHSHPRTLILIPLSATILAIALEKAIEIHDTTISEPIRTIKTKGYLIDVTKFPTKNIIVAAIAHEDKMIIELYDPETGECLANFATGFRFFNYIPPLLRGRIICPSDTCIVAHGKDEHSGKEEIKIWN